MVSWPFNKQLLIYIKYVSSQQTMQAIADLFGVCEATVYSLVGRITSVICTELMPEIIKF
jgi:DNA-binding CsgD family transcriptional regulator